MSSHTMRVLMTDCGVSLEPECHQPEGAPCRVTCPEGCESWDGNHEHALVPSKTCTFVEWAENEGAETLYGGVDAETPIYHGMPIRVWFEGDTYLWSAK